MTDNNRSLYTVNTPLDETFLARLSSSSKLVERLKVRALSNNFGLIVTRSVHNLVHLSWKCSGKIKNSIINESERKRAPRKSIKQGCPFIIKIDTYPNGSWVVKNQDTSENEHLHNHDLSLGIGMPSTAIPVPQPPSSSDNLKRLIEQLKQEITSDEEKLQKRGNVGNLALR